jgi:hypothetical protein
MAIHFIDSDKIDITFTNLIINVSSLNKYGLSVNDFSVVNNLWGKTNGKLLVMTEMNEPAWELQKIIDTILVPKGFVFERDFVVAFEQLIHGAGNSITCLINQELPELLEIDWISSEIKMNGNFIWLKN